ncbi:MAG: daunorubicin/doxorubicin resistance ABC transporter ATP-binding protein DrrA, partial [Agromyces sp.]|nr:daunorubicin/doxorubicin resistance ABC transporter ATP-binding protein DrrA [Agromyces sp.]
LDAAGLEVDDLALRRPTLDEVFLHLTAPAQAPESAPDAADSDPAPSTRSDEEVSR